jgi:4-hydroxy-tetrahydrodipicolinate reductase
MKIALIGYGKMGKEIEQHARQKNIDIAGIFNRSQTATKEALQKADVCIDFSVSTAVLENVTLCAEAGKPVVLGTTGWLNQLNPIKKIVEAHRIGLIYASNFSIGVNLFFQMVDQASTLINGFPDYDIFVHEFHHNQKTDSPSGTALSLAKIITEKVSRKKKILTDKSEGKIASEKLHVTSTRIGSVPGTHWVGFDSLNDSIELKHTARTRAGFALGALYAAEWIVGKKGLFTMQDIFRSAK